VPLCTTTASQEIFDAFLSDSKSEALLHGHSYTAHAVGCNVAVESLKQLNQVHNSGETSSWSGFAKSWNPSSSQQEEVVDLDSVVWSTWNSDIITALSHKSCVSHINALGSVLSIALDDEAGGGKVFFLLYTLFLFHCSISFLPYFCSIPFHPKTTRLILLGYTSTAATSVQKSLLQSKNGWCIHSRVLGNVIYFMASQTASQVQIRQTEERIWDELGVFDDSADARRAEEVVREKGLFNL